jgi:membrane protease YdiL (CAAX protease family)
MKMHRKQLIVFFVLLLAHVLSVFVTYAFFLDELAAFIGVPAPDMGISGPVLGLEVAGVILVFYGIFGLVGYWFARKLDLPGIFSADGNWRRWLLIPFLLGLACGVALVLGDLLFAPINGLGRFVHPPFPTSILASLSAGIGEEIVFRGFVFGLWGLILNWLLKRFRGRSLALWIANLIAALAFGAGHLPAILALTGATSPAELSPILLAEMFLLNGIVGLVAGERYMKDGLVAAAGVHFWTDVVFHVMWGLF